jgi:hypothetical protein
MEKISWTDHVKNGKVLLRVKEQRNILHGIGKRKANCLPYYVIETKDKRRDKSDTKTRKKT